MLTIVLQPFKQPLCLCCCSFSFCAAYVPFILPGLMQSFQFLPAALPAYLVKRCPRVMSLRMLAGRWRIIGALLAQHSNANGQPAAVAEGDY